MYRRYYNAASAYLPTAASALLWLHNQVAARITVLLELTNPEMLDSTVLKSVLEEVSRLGGVCWFIFVADTEPAGRKKVGCRTN